MSEKKWNYRVIEFVDPRTLEAWKSIHEVQYEDDEPVSYSENPAHITWDILESDDAAFAILKEMKLAIHRPTLIEDDFKTAKETS